MPITQLRTQPTRLTTWPLVVATFFMVSGGTYGIEDVVRGAGYTRAILILLITPIIWSLPTAYMIAELSSALPEEGGFYVWVRRAMGNFWGFQEAWLSLVASIFDMAIYPTLFVAYLSRLLPWARVGRNGIIVGVAVVAVSAALNLAGIRAVSTTSIALFLLLSAPFVVIVVVSPFKWASFGHMVFAPSSAPVNIFGGLLVAMWNYMGWDNASTVAGEVDKPQRTYPRAMLLCVGLVAVTYVLPVAAVAVTRLSPSAWETGSWVNIATLIGGPLLGIAVVIGGMMSAFGMFNALVMSYSRLPLAMARDRMLPAAFGRLTAKSSVPWVAIVVLSTGWALCVGLGFERLIAIDILIYGSSLLLEFAGPRGAAHPGAEFAAALPRSGWTNRGSADRRGSHAVAGTRSAPCRTRTSAGDEQPRLRNARDRRWISGLWTECGLSAFSRNGLFLDQGKLTQE